MSLIPGDGIGPELAAAAQKVAGAGLGVDLDIRVAEAGDSALRDCGQALPDETMGAVRGSDACLKAPVGESAADVILVLRQKLGLYANIRPAKSYPGMPALRDDIDLVVVRENTEDLYTGAEFEAGRAAVALRIITEDASRRIARRALEAAAARSRPDPHVTCVHKSNVMRVTDGLFARVCREEAESFGGVRFEEMYVDACAMNLIRRPESFDVILTTNMFGDIISDESSQAAGGLGMAPAANIGDDFALFEPVHGAAFDIAGTDSANPSSMILSLKMMLEWLGMRHEDESCARAASRIEGALYEMVAAGDKTRDIGGSLGTQEFAARLASRI